MNPRNPRDASEACFSGGEMFQSVHQMSRLPGQLLPSQTCQSPPVLLLSSPLPLASRGRGRLQFPLTNQVPNNQCPFCASQPPALDIPYLRNYSPLLAEIKPQYSRQQHQYVEETMQWSEDKPPSNHLEPTLYTTNLMQPSQNSQKPFPHPDPIWAEKLPCYSYDEPRSAENLTVSSLDEAMLFQYHQLNQPKVRTPQWHRPLSASEEFLPQPCPPFELPSPAASNRDKLAKDQRTLDPIVHREHDCTKFCGHLNFEIKSDHGPVEETCMQNLYNGIPEKMNSQATKFHPDSCLTQSLDPCAPGFYPKQDFHKFTQDSTQVMKPYPEFRREPQWSREYVVLPSPKTPVNLGVRGRGRHEKCIVVPQGGMLVTEGPLAADFGIVSGVELTDVKKPQMSKSSEIKTAEMMIADYNSPKMERFLEIPDSKKPCEQLPPKAKDSRTPRSIPGDKEGRSKLNRHCGLEVYVPPPARKLGASPKAGQSTSDFSITSGRQRLTHLDSQKKEHAVIDKDQHNLKTITELDSRKQLNKGQVKLKDPKILARIGAGGDGEDSRRRVTLDPETEKCCELAKTAMVLRNSIPCKESCGSKPNTSVHQTYHRGVSKSMSNNLSMSKGSIAAMVEVCQKKSVAPKLIHKEESCRLELSSVVAKSTMPHRISLVKMNEGKSLAKVKEEMPIPALIPLYKQNTTCVVDEPCRAVRGSTGKELVNPIVQKSRKPFDTNSKSGDLGSKPTLSYNKPDNLKSPIGRVGIAKVAKALDYQNVLPRSVSQVREKENSENGEKELGWTDQGGSNKATAIEAIPDKESLKRTKSLKHSGKIPFSKPFPDLDVENQCLIWPA